MLTEQHTFANPKNVCASAAKLTGPSRPQEKLGASGVTRSSALTPDAYLAELEPEHVIALHAATRAR